MRVSHRNTLFLISLMVPKLVDGVCKTEPAKKCKYKDFCKLEGTSSIFTEEWCQAECGMANSVLCNKKCQCAAKLQIKPTELSSCDQFCEDSFNKRLHPKSGKRGSWFCRGLWGHKHTNEGGCSYWKRKGPLDLAACKMECSKAGFGDSGNWLIEPYDDITEAEMCKKGCEQGELVTAFTCVAGQYCQYRYTSSISKSKNEVKGMCLKESRCKAIDYRDGDNYGYLCESTVFTNVATFGIYEACSRSTGTALSPTPVPPKAVTKTTVNPDDLGKKYEKLKAKHCSSSKYGYYDKKLTIAKLHCLSDVNCSGVYVQKCDDTASANQIRLCRKTEFERSHTSSCVYKKLDSDPNQTRDTRKPNPEDTTDNTAGDATTEVVERGDTNNTRERGETSVNALTYGLIAGGAGCLILIGLTTFFLVKRIKNKKKRNSDYDDDDDGHYDYVSNEPKRNINRNEPASTATPGIVDNPYYEGSDNVLSTPGIERSANSGIETITVTENLYYEE